MMLINDINYIDDKRVEGELGDVVGGYYVTSLDVDQDFDVDIDIDKNFPWEEQCYLCCNPPFDCGEPDWYEVKPEGNFGSLEFDVGRPAGTDVVLVINSEVVEATGTLTAGVD